MSSRALVWIIHSSVGGTTQICSGQGRRSSCAVRVLMERSLALPDQATQNASAGTGGKQQHTQTHTGNTVTQTFPDITQHTHIHIYNIYTQYIHIYTHNIYTYIHTHTHTGNTVTRTFPGITQRTHIHIYNIYTRYIHIYTHAYTHKQHCNTHIPRHHTAHTYTHI